MQICRQHQPAFVALIHDKEAHLMQRKINDEMRLATVSQTAPTQAPILARADGSRKAWRSRGAAAGVIAPAAIKARRNRIRMYASSGSI